MPPQKNCLSDRNIFMQLSIKKTKTKSFMHVGKVLKYLFIHNKFFVFEMRLKSVFNATIICSGITFIPKPSTSLCFGILVKSLFYFSVSTLSRNATKQMPKFNSGDLHGVESPLSHGNWTMKYMSSTCLYPNNPDFCGDNKGKGKTPFSLWAVQRSSGHYLGRASVDLLCFHSHSKRTKIEWLAHNNKNRNDHQRWEANPDLLIASHNPKAFDP